MAGQLRSSQSIDSKDQPLKDLAAMEREHILRVLQETGWRIEGPTGAASILKLHPSTLRFRIKKLGIRRPA
jgi:transcriptional regulator with GAF, ATPase, and Fis domain